MEEVDDPVDSDGKWEHCICLKLIARKSFN